MSHSWFLSFFRVFRVFRGLRWILMRKKFVAGNWKMFTNKATARELATAVVRGLGYEQRISVAVSRLGLCRRGAARKLRRAGSEELLPREGGCFHRRSKSRHAR